MVVDLLKGRFVQTTKDLFKFLAVFSWFTNVSYEGISMIYPLFRVIFSRIYLRFLHLLLLEQRYLLWLLDRLCIYSGRLLSLQIVSISLCHLHHIWHTDRLFHNNFSTMEKKYDIVFALVGICIRDIYGVFRSQSWCRWLARGQLVGKSNWEFGSGCWAEEFLRE